MKLSSYWIERKRPSSLEAKFIFENYKLMRDFLDGLSEISENIDHHPNISFGRDYVSILIYPKSEQIDKVDYELALRVDELYKKYLVNSQNKRVES